MSLKRLASLGGSEAPIVRRQLRELAEEADEREREMAYYPLQPYCGTRHDQKGYKLGSGLSSIFLLSSLPNWYTRFRFIFVLSG